jgi:uncharacterized membrane protein
MADHIRNPIEWAGDQIRLAALAVGSLGRSLRGSQYAPLPAVCRIKAADLRDVLVRGLGDFGAYRTDVIFLCLIYPVVGIVLTWLIFGYEMLQLLFPLAWGFALVGPVAAVGLYEMSRRREQGNRITWVDAFGVIRSPGFGAILVLGLVLLAIFLLWLLAANVIYQLTLGPEPPVSIAAFARDVFTTSAGWAMIVMGVGVGFLFALLVLAISVVSFPLLLDRDIGLDVAVWTSIRAVAANPGPMAVRGLIVAGPTNFTLLWSSEHARPDDVIDINRIRIWSHDHLLFDAEFLDSEFGSNRYRVSAFERGTWLDVVASALMLQFREEGDAIRH